jgi:hypothetical protein
MTQNSERGDKRRQRTAQEGREKTGMKREPWEIFLLEQTGRVETSLDTSGTPSFFNLEPVSPASGCARMKLQNKEPLRPSASSPWKRGAFKGSSQRSKLESFCHDQTGS